MSTPTLMETASLENGPRASRVETWLAFCMATAPVLSILASLFGPQTTGFEGEIRAIRQNPGQWIFTSFLWILASVFWVGAATGVVRMLSGRSFAAGCVAWFLVVLGSVFHAALISYALVEVPLIHSDLPRAETESFIAERMYEHSAFLWVLLPFAGFYVGQLALSVTAWRGRAAPVWVPAMVLVALALGPLWHHPVSNVTTFTLFLGAYSILAGRALRTTPRSAAPILKANVFSQKLT